MGIGSIIGKEGPWWSVSIQNHAHVLREPLGHFLPASSCRPAEARLGSLPPWLRASPAHRLVAALLIEPAIPPLVGARGVCLAIYIYFVCK